jgi:predicted permease
MLSQIFAIIAPVFAIAALGYIWERRKMPFDTTGISYLVSYIGAPGLMIHTLLTNKPDLAAAARIVVVAVVLVAVMAAVGWGVARAFKLAPKVYLPAVMFPNSGNMGVPLCLFAFGQEGLAYAVTYLAVMAGMQFSIGAGIASGEISVKAVFTNPVIIAIAFAAVLLVTGTDLPAWSMNILEILGNILVPLMLMSLGTSLARLQVAGFKRAVGFSVLRLAGGFVVANILVWVLGLEGAARGTVIVQSSMPIAVFSYMFAVRYDNRPEEIAGMVFISTLMSFASLPFLMAYVLSL